MGNAVLDFNQFTDMAVKQNGLVSQEDLARSKRFLILHPQMNLVDVFLRYKLITPRHSELITKKFQEYQEKIMVTGAAPSDSPDRERETGTPAMEIVEKSESRTAANAEPGGEQSFHTAAENSGPAAAGPDVKIVPASDTLKKLLLKARQESATDLFINVNSPPIIRKHGHLVPLGNQKLDAARVEALLFGALTEEQQVQLRKEQVLEPCLVIDSLRYRACFVEQRIGWDGSFRVIPKDVPDFEALGLPLEVAQLAEYREGMVLITGPGGSGKSTTLASYIHMLNQSRSEHIITLEDPIEYVFQSEASHISQRQVGLHTQSYSHALRAALREDPDIIVVGELRDKETVSLAVTAAETGHLVFATLHTTGAAQTVHRLLDLFPPAQRNQIRAQISDSLRGIVCQRLIPAADGKGVCLAVEVMFNISSIANLMREDRIFQIPNMIQINHKYGMRLLDESIQKLLAEGRIGHREAFNYANNKMLFEKSAAIIEKEDMQENVNAAH